MARGGGESAVEALAMPQQRPSQLLLTQLINLCKSSEKAFHLFFTSQRSHDISF